MAALTRDEYYSKWDKIATDEVQRAEGEDEKEKEGSNAACGLDKDLPRSEAEKLDREQDKKLREQKKVWDTRKKMEEEAKMVIDGEKGSKREITKDILGNKLVLLIKNCQACEFVVSRGCRLVKMFVEDCSALKLDIRCMLITQHVEVLRCKDSDIIVGHPTATMQFDLCDTVTLSYGQNIFRQDSDKVYHAGVKGLKMLADGQEETVDSEALASQDWDGKTPKNEIQFVTHRPGQYCGRFRTEKVIREAGMPAPSSQSLKKDADGGSREEAETQAATFKLQGNEAFKLREYAQAAIHYTQAIECLPKGSEASFEAFHVCLSNRSACFLKLGDHERALKDADECVSVSPKYVKGLFRKGLSLKALGRFHEAMKCFTVALELEPKNQQIKDAAHFCEFRIRKAMAAGR